jgi:hypothetical protein
MNPSTDIPTLQVIRSCKNCKFYKHKKHSTDRDPGICLLPQLIDQNNPVRETHCSLTCSAHVWKRANMLQKMQIKYNAEYIE